MAENKGLREILALAAMPIMLILVEIIAVILAVPMIRSGYAMFEDPTSLENPVWFIAMLLGFTIILLVLLKYHMKKVLQALIWASILLSFIYVFSGLLALAGADMILIAFPGLPFLDLSILGLPVGIPIIGILMAIGATALLIHYPEWYIVDILGVLLSAGLASLFGISLEPVPVILLLILLAVYDALSVYRTKHMLTLAEGMIDNRMPIMVVVPKREGYSFIRDGIGGNIVNSEKIHGIQNQQVPEPEEKKERAAFLMGLGDLIMPAILVVSAAVFLPGSGISGFTIPVVTTIAGSVAGMGLLLYFVSSGRPQAGLPPLNGGAIIGFLIGYLIIGM